jgi:cytochrome c-type biogenesis protein CcmH
VRLLDDPAAATEAELRTLAARLAARTERAPEDPDAWFLLGRAALTLGEYERAAQAFGRVSELTAGAVVPGVFRAQALYLADDRTVTPRVREAVDVVLERAPGQPIMLELLAMDAFRGERWEEAAQLFARVLQAGEVNDPERQRFLLEGLTVARERAGLPPLPFARADGAAGGGTEAEDGEASIAVEVTVPEAVLAGLPATARLFVLARNPGGGMPLAVERHEPAARVRLELTAADAMGPAASLASAGSVEVVARLSLAGTATRGEGDLEAVAGPVPAAAGARIAFTLAPDAPAPRVDLPAREPAATVAASAEPPAAAPEASVRVLVELAPELSAPADATVYVFARAVGGPPMPLAVTRLEAAALPSVVTLSDAQAMVPGQGLGSVPEVELVARVSASGDVRGAPGDLEGRAGPVDPRATERVVPLLVDRVLP